MIGKYFLTLILFPFVTGEGPPTPSPIYYKPYVPPSTQESISFDFPSLSEGLSFKTIDSSPSPFLPPSSKGSILPSLPPLPAYSSYVSPPQPPTPPLSVNPPIVPPSPLPAPTAPIYRPTTSPSVPVYKPLTQPPISPVYKPYVPPPAEPVNYAFEYSVFDAESGVDISADEQAINGDVEGSYKVALPDGRIKTVTYYVSGNSGFVADVTYEAAPAPPVVTPYPQYVSYIK